VKAPVELDDVKARRADRSDRVARRPAATERARPEQLVDGALENAEHSMLGSDVFVKAKLTAGSQHAAELAQRKSGIADATQDPDGDPGIEATVLGGQRFGVSFRDIDAHCRVTRTLRRRRASRRIGLDGEHVLHCRRVVLEGAAVTAAELEHPPAQTCEQPAPVLALEGIGPSERAALEVPREARLLRAVERRIRRRRPTFRCGRSARRGSRPVGCKR
jgi:hypothetical protein